MSLKLPDKGTRSVVEELAEQNRFRCILVPLEPFDCCFSSSIVQGCSIKHAGLDELMGPCATKTQCHIKDENPHIDGVVPTYVCEWTIEVIATSPCFRIHDPIADPCVFPLSYFAPVRP